MRSALDSVYIVCPLLRGFCHAGPQEPGDWVHSDHLPVIAELDWPVAIDT